MNLLGYENPDEAELSDEVEALTNRSEQNAGEVTVRMRNKNNRSDPNNENNRLSKLISINQEVDIDQIVNNTNLIVDDLNNSTNKKWVNYIKKLFFSMFIDIYKFFYFS